MIDLLLIILLIISLFKPDILLSKKVKERASQEQQTILVKNSRKIYAILVAFMESLALMRYVALLGVILMIIFFILFLTVSLPAVKENRRILKELGI